MVFSKINLSMGYHYLKIKEEGIPKIAFLCRYSLYEFRVMPFRLTNAHAAFIDLMNRVFQHTLDQYIIVFINEILVYSKRLEEHAMHLIEVLETLHQNQLYVKLSKCSF